MADEIVKTKVYSNCVVGTHIPIRTVEEEKIQQKRLYEAAERFAKVIERTKMEKEKRA